MEMGTINSRDTISTMASALTWIMEQTFPSLYSYLFLFIHMSSLLVCSVMRQSHRHPHNNPHSPAAY
ncbi:hypothetical protein XELAEV_18036779mg [Xenopus laevis]|uniref:Uncharacterized protein n=1 Tax=Xenopus laevis TaxID=8355 RepID=A0A974CAV0_XENLA|nr:hypothetical protein XELAEV_18036779mg [Xenopus laevis]